MPSSAALLSTLAARFAAHPHRHPGLVWEDVLARLHRDTAALQAVAAMEASGGEPDVIGRDEATGEFLFVDCSPQSPTGRRSCCFDRAALDARKVNKPAHSAEELADAMGVTLLDEAMYRHLQTLGAFDTTTSSWIETPARIRALGGALFGDRRFDTVFVYHNGAESYYAARGFRALRRV
ncbi:MAG: DUF4256 domain-containing protein [Gemmatimonadaceae bacterium]|jgi:hypothetical protein|nr:DUF4256 domain-containing protein [Gemmatimonadaceae bacterium]